MANNKLIHEKYGELDLEQPHLNRPDLPRLWQTLRRDKRPVEQRQLICGYCLKDHGERVPMYLRQNPGGLRVAVHQYGDAERRHTPPESDEHKAYKARVHRVATSAGFTAVAEKPSRDRRVRSDILIHGATGPIAWEVQRTEKSAASIARRDATARRNHLTTAWHTDRTALASRNEVAWLHTDDLPAFVIERTRRISMYGVSRLRWERCDHTNPLPCPIRGRGRCGDRHPQPEADGADLDHVVRRIAEGALTRIVLKGAARQRKLWVPSQDRDRCADAGLLRHDPHHTPGPVGDTSPGGTSDAEPTCVPGRHPSGERGTGPGAHSRALPTPGSPTTPLQGSREPRPPGADNPAVSNFLDPERHADLIEQQRRADAAHTALLSYNPADGGEENEQQAAERRRLRTAAARAAETKRAAILDSGLAADHGYYAVDVALREAARS